MALERLPRPRQRRLAHESIYFCEAHSPWPRPTNENTNGLLRDYLQKGTGLAAHSAKRLREVQDELNNRLHKCLNWENPQQSSRDYSQTIRKPELRRSLEFACPQVGPD
jgi:IS30 family transposase